MTRKYNDYSAERRLRIATGDLTDAELDEIEARANAATEGPWQIDRVSGDVIGPGEQSSQLSYGGVLVSTHPCVTIAVSYELDAAWGAEPEDMVFIANARTDVPRLVAEVRRLRALVSVPEDAPTLNDIAGKHGDTDLVVW